jgi:hypothetical protein
VACRVQARTIFRRYLDLGSMGALIEDLDRRGFRTKAAVRLDGRVRGGIRFGVDPLAHLLKNRFYIGEVVYRGNAAAETALSRNLPGNRVGGELGLNGLKQVAIEDRLMLPCMSPVGKPALSERQ